MNYEEMLKVAPDALYPCRADGCPEPLYLCNDEACAKQNNFLAKDLFYYCGDDRDGACFYCIDCHPGNSDVSLLDCLKERRDNKFHKKAVKLVPDVLYPCADECCAEFGFPADELHLYLGGTDEMDGFYCDGHAPGLGEWEITLAAFLKAASDAG